MVGIIRYMINGPDNNPSESDRVLIVTALLSTMTASGMSLQDAFDVLAGREFGNMGNSKEAIKNAIIGLNGVAGSGEPTSLQQYVNDYAEAWNMKPEDAEARLKANNPDLFENPPWE